MPETCNAYTLSEIVDKYMIRQENLKRKGYKRYLSISQDVWRRCFWNTLWIVKNTWVTIQGAGPNDPYDFIYVPKDCVRFFSVSVEDECGNLTPLYYNSKLSVIKKPDHTNCSCDKCGGSGLSGQMEAFDVITKPVVIGTQTFYEKTWIKYCQNGEVLEYKEIPTPKYNTIQQSGDYNNDYNGDYNTVSTFGNYTVVTQVVSRKLCTLETKPCGCPVDSPENENLLFGCCGCFVKWWRHRRYCDRFLERINYNGRGEIKFSECGTKIYLKQARCTPEQLRTKRFVSLKYQSNGTDIGEDVLVPLYAEYYMYSGIDLAAKEFNPRFTETEKLGAKYRHEDYENKLIMFLNPLEMETLSNIQDANIRW